MTMILKKDFTSFNHRLFVVPVSVRAISFKSSPSGELSYYIKKPDFMRAVAFRKRLLSIIFKEDM